VFGPAPAMPRLYAATEGIMGCGARPAPFARRGRTAGRLRRAPAGLSRGSTPRSWVPSRWLPSTAWTHPRSAN